MNRQWLHSDLLVMSQIDLNYSITSTVTSPVVFSLCPRVNSSTLAAIQFSCLPPREFKINNETISVWWCHHSIRLSACTIVTQFGWLCGRAYIRTLPRLIGARIEPPFSIATAAFPHLLSFAYSAEVCIQASATRFAVISIMGLGYSILN